MKAVRVALIGCGGFAASYRRAYTASPLARIAALVDANLATARMAARDCGVDESLATTIFSRALEDDVDALVIGSPNHLHVEHGTQALQAGKHVLMQKPLAPSVVEAQALAALADRAGVVAAVYHSYLDRPLVHELRAAIRLGSFGDVSYVHGRVMHPGGLAWSDRALAGQPTWRSSRVYTGGGCFIQLGIHYVHLLSWLLGEEPVAATGMVANLRTPGLEGEDIAVAMLRYPSGALGTIDTAWITSGETLTIAGSQGEVRYEDDRWLRGSWKGPAGGMLAGIQRDREVLPPALDDVENRYNGHRTFLEAVCGLREIPVNFRQAIDSLRVVEAVYASARADAPSFLQQRSPIL